MLDSSERGDGSFQAHRIRSSTAPPKTKLLFSNNRPSRVSACRRGNHIDKMSEFFFVESPSTASVKDSCESSSDVCKQSGDSFQVLPLRAQKKETPRAKQSGSAIHKESDSDESSLFLSEHNRSTLQCPSAMLLPSDADLVVSLPSTAKQRILTFDHRNSTYTSSFSSSCSNSPKLDGTDASLAQENRLEEKNITTTCVTSASSSVISQPSFSSLPFLVPTVLSLKASMSSVASECLTSPVVQASMPQFGCCVFFFPEPVVSWLFPLAGHVAISNAEGTKLYTFESSYYVREEQLIDVLDHVINGVPKTRADLSQERECEFLHARVSSSRSFPGFPAGSAGGESLPVSCSRCITRASGGCSSGARRVNRISRCTSVRHAHIACVRIWDLKPLLMERCHGLKSRIRAASVAGSRVAMLLFQRLQEILHSEERRNKSTSNSGEMNAPKLNNDSTLKGDRDYQLIDAPTASFYNRNLQATISIFRDGPDGSNNSPDILLKNPSSFSFVGFVLEVCGVGDPFVSGGRTRSLPLSHGTASSTDTSPLVFECDSSISWGTLRLLASIGLFGQWYCNDRRAWREFQGGTVLGAVVMWAILIIVFYYIVLPLVPRVMSTVRLL